MEAEDDGKFRRGFEKVGTKMPVNWANCREKSAPNATCRRLSFPRKSPRTFAFNMR